MMEERNTYKIYEGGNIGEVQIADDVVASIAGLAATEVKGVISLAGGVTAELISKLGMKKLSKGVKVVVEESNVTVSVAINVEFGSNIPEVSAKVQEKVKTTVENMTGLSVIGVNVKVLGIGEE
ncbi:MULTISPECIES: Asp23/Gls24 family envelope stress response protein [Eubacterium]|nr:Asp23/Gls24 family envelope stress response protein [Eubacterium sp.]HAV89765.1 Asp23/Gls24 family envelope stress response protein [Eubacterium sp.]